MRMRILMQPPRKELSTTELVSALKLKEKIKAIKKYIKSLED